MAKSYFQDNRTAWDDATRKWPERKKYNKPDLDKMKAEYVAKYGYTVLIPDFGDVVHYKPDEWMSVADRRERKARNLQRILSSPSPEWAQSYSSAMCWIDNIQDAMTTGLVLSLLVRKWLPKVFARAVPVLGWMLLAYDLLSFMIQMGRTPFTPMKAKRALCEVVRSNPFTKKAKRRRHFRLWNMRPGWGAACEILQTTDWLLGVGLCLGSIMGTIMDSAFALHRYATGDRVRWVREPQAHEIYDITRFKSLRAAAMISSAGQVFDDEFHFWTYITYTGNALFAASTILDDPPEEYYEDPMDVMIPADRPTNPETIEVIEAAGLSVEDGVRWPANNEKEIVLHELSDWQAQHCYKSTIDYLFRHKKDWNGFLAAGFMHEAHNLLLDSLDPGAEVDEEYEPITHVSLQMVKNGITPTDETQTQQWGKFAQWTADHRAVNKEWPSIKEVTQRLDLYGVAYRTSFATIQDERAKDVFPPESLDATLWETDFDKWEF